MSKWTGPPAIYTVYEVVHCSTGRVVYVGETRRTLHARLQAHSDHLDSPIHDLISLHGKSDFNIRAIDHAETFDEALAKEEFWTRFLISQGHKLYNKDYAKKHSEETKKKLSDSHKGQLMSESTKAKLSAANKGRFTSWSHLRSKHPLCIETGIIYGSVSEAARKLGLNVSGIAEVARGQRETAGGYHWKYVSLRKENVA